MMTMMTMAARRMMRFYQMEQPALTERLMSDIFRIASGLSVEAILSQQYNVVITVPII
jgi:hypothetical protein